MVLLCAVSSDANTTERAWILGRNKMHELLSQAKCNEEYLNWPFLTEYSFSPDELVIACGDPHRTNREKKIIGTNYI